MVFDVIQHNRKPECVCFSTSGGGVQKAMFSIQKGTPCFFLKRKGFPILLAEPIFGNMEQFRIFQGMGIDHCTWIENYEFLLWGFAFLFYDKIYICATKFEICRF